MRPFTCLLLLGLVTAAPALAEADGPDAWRITGVAADDRLNVRAGPSVDYPVLGSYAHDARGLQTVICIPTLTASQYFALSEADQAAIGTLPNWCAIAAPEGGVAGWVNARFLTEDS